MRSRRQTLPKFLTAALLVAALPFTALAGENPHNSRFHAELHGDLRKISGMLASAPRSGARRHIAPLVIDGVLPGIGRVRGELSERKDKDWPAWFSEGGNEKPDYTDVVFLNGKVRLARTGFEKRVPLAGSLVSSKDGYKLILHFKSARSRTRSGETFFRLEGTLPAAQFGDSAASFRLQHAPRVPSEHDLCVAHGTAKTAPAALAGVSNGGVVPRAAVPAEILLRATISTDGDFEWFQRYGSESNAQMAVLINATEVIYERDLGLIFDLTRQRTWSDPAQPFISTNADELLASFTKYGNQHGQTPLSDLHHLFTGKRLDDNIAGISWVSVVCSAPAYSYSATEHVNEALDHLLVAHELGHNFGAQHDTNTLPPTIMYPSISESQTSFSDESKRQIAVHLSQFSDCLDKVTSNPSPSPTPKPTPGGSSSPGSGVAPQDFELPQIAFSAKLSRAGTFTAKAALSGQVHSECFSRVTAARGPGFKHKTTLAEFAGDLAEFHLENPARRLMLRSGTTPPKVYLRVEYLCPAEGRKTYSLPAKVFPSRNHASNSTRSLSQWLVSLAQSIRDTNQ